jgi:putative peptidoglycan lipid II flippase
VETRSGLPVRWIVAAVAVLVTGTALLAYLVGQHGTPPTTSNEAAPRSPQSTTASVARRIPVQDATSFDPYPGSGDENPALVPLAIDGNPATAWQTVTYYGNPALGGIKDGVGLVLDLGANHNVSRVDVMLTGSPTNLQLRAAPASASVAPASSAHQYRLVASRKDAGTSVAFHLRQPVSTRFLLVWLTSLPPDGANAYRGGVSEIKVFG